LNQQVIAMALAGAGVLAIWNGIDPEAEADFLDWHVNEHIPERVAVPGFLKARRYKGHESWPRYFNFYEVDGWETLVSKSYLDRLNTPSPWTQRVVQHFRDTFRTMCSVAISAGQGDGPYVATYRLKTTRNRTDFINGMRQHAIEPILQRPAIVGAHLLEGQKSPHDGPTAEKALRGQPDAIADWILLIESVDESELKKAMKNFLSQDSFTHWGAQYDPLKDVGFYQLQYALANNQLSVR
jgi:hypothetical protein